MLIHFNKLNLGDKFVRVSHNSDEISTVMIKYSNNQATDDAGNIVGINTQEVVAKLKPPTKAPKAKKFSRS